jgi:cytochrome c peroxidase
MHDGVYPTLEAVVRHYNNVDSALKSFDATQLDASLRASYHGDAGTIAAVEKTLDFRLQRSLGLTPDEQQQIVAFLKSLTDPAARTLGSIVPSSVPSGLPLP